MSGIAVTETASGSDRMLPRNAQKLGKARGFIPSCVWDPVAIARGSVTT